MIILGPDPNKKAILITAILFFFNTYKFKIPLDKSSLVKRKKRRKKEKLIRVDGILPQRNLLQNINLLV